MQINTTGNMSQQFQLVEIRFSNFMILTIDLLFFKAKCTLRNHIGLEVYILQKLYVLIFTYL